MPPCEAVCKTPASLLEILDPIHCVLCVLPLLHRPGRFDKKNKGLALSLPSRYRPPVTLLDKAPKTVRNNSPLFGSVNKETMNVPVEAFPDMKDAQHAQFQGVPWPICDTHLVDSVENGLLRVAAEHGGLEAQKRSEAAERPQVVVVFFTTGDPCQYLSVAVRVDGGKGGQLVAVPEANTRGEITVDVGDGVAGAKQSKLH
jgi:hypothetical protein